MLPTGLIEFGNSLRIPYVPGSPDEAIVKELTEENCRVSREYIEDTRDGVWLEEPTMVETPLPDRKGRKVVGWYGIFCPAQGSL